MGTRYYVSYTVVSGRPESLTLNGQRTYMSSDDREIAEQRAAFLLTQEGSLELLRQLLREPEYRGLEMLRIQDVEVREVSDGS